MTDVSEVTVREAEEDTAEPYGSVFVSYSRRDREFVDKLAAALAAAGRNAWVDADDIPPTARWRDEIRTALTHAGAVVFVVSPSSIASAECARELEFATSLNKRLVPVLLHAVDPADTPEAVAERQWIEFDDPGSFDESFSKLLRALDVDLEWVNEHTRWLTDAVKWAEEERDRSLLLRGAALGAAERWLSTPGAADKDPPPTSLQYDYVLASRAATTRRQRLTFAAVGAASVIAFALAAVAFVERNHAVAQSRASTSRELAADALLNLSQDPELSVLLAAAATRKEQTPEAVSALRQSLSASQVRLTLRGHHGRLTDVAWSPGGRRIATSADDGTARLWDPQTGRLVATLHARVRCGFSHHAACERTVNGVEFGANGRLVLSWGQDGYARLWRASDGRRVATFQDDPDHTGRLDAATFSPDGTRVATASFLGGTVHVWSSSSAALLATLRLSRHVGVIPDDIAISPNDRRVAVATQGRAVDVFALPGGRLTRRLRASGRQLPTVRFSPNGRLLVAAANDGTATVWRVSDGRRLAVLGNHGSAGLTKAVFDPTGRVVATASLDGTADLWDAHTGRRLAELTGHRAAVGDVSFDHDGTHVVTASDDGTARVWDVATGTLVADLRGHRGAVVAAVFSPDGERVATASEDGTARIWDAGRQHALHLLRSGQRPRRYGALDLLMAHGTAAALQGDLRILIWDTADSRLITSVPLPRTDGDLLSSDDPSIAYSANGGVVTAMVAPAHVGAWNARSGLRLDVFRHGGFDGSTVALSNDGRLVAVGRDDGRVTIWRVRSGARVGVARAPVAPTTLAFSPDDTRLVGGGPDGLARMWTVGGRTIKTLRQAPRASDESVDAIAFSPRGNVLMTSGDDGTVKLWNASTETRLRIIRADTAAPPKYFQGVSASFSPDGSRILTSTYWGVKARIWDAQTGALQLELEGHAGGIGSSSWSPDGKFALTVGFDGTVRVWDASNGQPLLVVHAAPTGRLGGNGGAVFADFAGADDRIATLGEDGVIHLYACDVCGDVNHLLQLATKRTTRGLTSQEQRVYLHKS